MAENIKPIMDKLYAKANLTEEELSKLRAYVDQLETAGLAAESEHHTSSSPGSHYTDHRTSVVDLAGILERVQLRAGGSKK
jgi:hypothetical protein